MISGIRSDARIDAVANEILTQIEVRETRVLNWGFVETQMDLQAELPGLVEELREPARSEWADLCEGGATPRDLLRNLVDRCLVFATGPHLYRSRYAETVRLLALLRQRFKEGDWNSAPRLVGDLKMDLQRRRYPRRDIDRDEVLEELRATGADPVELKVVESLLQFPDGTPLQVSKFQKEAIVALTENFRRGDERAVVIGAGTGTGKTKAFYVPAFAQIAASMAESDARWTRGLALYPRTELLKDQLIEAFREARKLDGVLPRPLALGAYYGDTPWSAAQVEMKWVKAEDGYVCPFFNCIEEGQHDRRMVWRFSDVERAGKTGERTYARLECVGCGDRVTAEQLLLTREQMSETPPDMLLTTMEMLNRRLSNVQEHRVFGMYADHPPFLLLLDEIHVQEGLSGAQVACLLRRWRHARRRGKEHKLSIVGLSATLTDAETFFSALTGLPQSRVRYIHPRREDMVEEGVEYNLVLKGDPVSGTTLLSTTVQTAMLLERALDPLHPTPGKTAPSRGAYGRKLFAFTDNLDVVNRWFHIELDAEQHKQLSKLRDPQPGQAHEAARNREGQVWTMCTAIGHNLKKGLRLDIVDAQNPGIDREAELVIATSTLEVGFNDDMVGGVLQHKAPRSIAALIQRKGRAGRSRGMRPWLVIVTSAYGHDRWAFQHAETLFAPDLPPINLPLDNYYVRKIQACFALMDWLARRLRTRAGSLDIWDLLTVKGKKENDWRTSKRREIAKVLLGVLDGSEREGLGTHLRWALGLRDEGDIHTLLWQEPRSLMFEVIPTLVRQLETDWQRVEGREVVPWTDVRGAHPMSEFAPANLFSALSLPELIVRVPKKAGGGKPAGGKWAKQGAATSVSPAEPVLREEYMELAQGLDEYAPGRVSKRYALAEHVREAHWLHVPEDVVPPYLELSALKVERDSLPTPVAIDAVTYRLFRPRAYTLEQIPPGLSDRSYGAMIWRSHFRPTRRGGGGGASPGDDGSTGIELSPDSMWASVFRDIRAYTHGNGAWVDVSRLAVGVATNTRYTNGASASNVYGFRDGGEPAALGFTLSADALRFDFVVPDVRAAMGDPGWPGLYSHLAPAYFASLLQGDARLTTRLSTFEIDWMAQLELSMLTATAVGAEMNLQDAAEYVSTHRLQLVERTLHVIFQSQQAENDEGAATPEEEDEEFGRLGQRIREYSQDPRIVEVLEAHAEALWNDGYGAMGEWLTECYAASLGAAVFTTVSDLTSDVDARQLHGDVQGTTIWISETSAGGVGLVSRLADAMAQRPREFEMRLRDAMEYCPREQLAIRLETIAALLREGTEEIREAFARARSASDLPKQEATASVLARELERHGMPATRELIVALNSKFLRPNSGEDSDALLAELVEVWHREEKRLGVAIDVRVIAVAAARHAQIRQRVEAVLRRVGGDANVTDAQVYNLLQSLLWLHCHDGCKDCIEAGHRFYRPQAVSRGLLLHILAPERESISFGAEGWEELVDAALHERHYTTVVCSQADLDVCTNALLHFVLKPIEVGFQLFHAAVERVGRSGPGWEIDLVIPELVRR